VSGNWCSPIRTRRLATSATDLNIDSKLMRSHFGRRNAVTHFRIIVGSSLVTLLYLRFNKDDEDDEDNDDLQMRK